MVRVPKNVARIAYLHVLHSAVPTKAKSIFGMAKSSFGTSCGLSFLVSILRNHRSRHATFYSNMAKELELIKKKRTSATGISVISRGQ